MGGRSQARSGLLDRQGEMKIRLALDTVEHRWRLEGFLLGGVEGFHPGHGRPPDGVVPRWPQRAPVQHELIDEEPWYVSPNPGSFGEVRREVVRETMKKCGVVALAHGGEVG